MAQCLNRVAQDEWLCIMSPYPLDSQAISIVTLTCLAVRRYSETYDGTCGMQVALFLAFLGSALFAVIFVWKSKRAITTKVMILASVVLIALAAYVFANSSAISPFSRSSGMSFGAQSDSIVSIGIALVGAIGGVFGSYLFNLGGANLNLRSLLRPLCACPLVIIPTIKLIETGSDQSILAYILLFALSYQNGFFWERLLKAEP